MLTQVHCVMCKSTGLSKEVKLIPVKSFRHKQETRLNRELNYQRMSTENSCWFADIDYNGLCREGTKHWIFVFFIFPGDLSHTTTSSHLVQKEKIYWCRPTLSNSSLLTMVYFLVCQSETLGTASIQERRFIPAIPKHSQQGPKLRT